MTRFNTIKQLIPGISSNLLSDRLDDLEKIGFVKKIIMDKPSVKVGYVLDEKCINLKKIATDIDEWKAWYIQSNTKQILDYNDSILIKQILDLLKKEIKDSEYQFIKDKLSLLQLDHSNFTNEFDKIKNIIFELYGDNLGTVIIQKLEQSIKK